MSPRARIGVEIPSNAASSRLDPWVTQRVVHGCHERLRRERLAQVGASPKPERPGPETPSVAARRQPLRHYSNTSCWLLGSRNLATPRTSR